MNNEKAIELLKSITVRDTGEKYNDNEGHTRAQEIGEALEMAIKALSNPPICPYLSDDEVRQPCIEGPCIADHCERPQDDCISRELLKKDIEAQISDFNELNKKGEPYKEFKDIRAILFGLFIGKNLIDNAPTVDAIVNTIEVRPKGEYISVDNLWAKCSICGNLTRIIKKYNMPNFCPACGADMRKGAAQDG